MVEGEILILSQRIQSILLEPDIVIVVQIVQPDNCKTLIQQNLGRFRAYESGSAGQQYGFHINSRQNYYRKFITFTRQKKELDSKLLFPEFNVFVVHREEIVS